MSPGVDDNGQAPHLFQVPGDEDLLEHLLLHHLAGRPLLGPVGRRPLVQLAQHPLLLVLCDARVHYEIEQLLHGEDVHALLAEEVCQVGEVLAQELQRVRVVVLHGLGHVDDEGLAFVVQDVELAQVAVNQLADVVDPAHGEHQVPVELPGLGL
jgi:hypothetical protein